MPKILALYCLIFLVVACQKEEIQPVPGGNTPNTYTPTGDILILVIGNQFEEAYEYDLSSAYYYTDTLPIWSEFTSSNSLFDDTTYFFFDNTSDTLCAQPHQGLTIHYRTPVDLNLIDTANFHLSFSPLEFEKAPGLTQNDLETLWHKVSHLSIVHAYRNSAHSKMYILRTVEYVFDASLGFSTPELKHQVIISKW